MGGKYKIKTKINRQKENSLCFMYMTYMTFFLTVHSPHTSLTKEETFSVFSLCICYLPALNNSAAI